MSENVDNLILAQLREIRGEMASIRTDMTGMRDDIATIRSDMSHVDQKVDGLTVMLAGHVHHIEERVEKLEGKPQ